MQTERGQETTENGEFGQIIESDDDDVELARRFRTGRNLDFNGVPGLKPRRHSDMGADFLGGKAREIVVVHPDEKLVDCAFSNLRTARLNSFFPLFPDHTLSYQEAWTR